MKFFRRIRQRHIKKEKFRKYLLYATGEIFLVVIGILIALQVNNWNENGKTNIRNNQYLISLSEEIENNIEAFSSYQNDLKRWADTTHYFLNLMNGDVQPEDSTIVIMTREAGPVYRLEISKSAVNDIIRSGSLESITDTHFKKALQFIPKYYEFFESRMNDSEVQWLNFTKPYYHQNANLLAMWETIDEYKMPESQYSTNITAFYKNRDFSNLMITRLVRLTNLKAATDNAITSLKEVNGQILEQVNE